MIFLKVNFQVWRADNPISFGGVWFQCDLGSAMERNPWEFWSSNPWLQPAGLSQPCLSQPPRLSAYVALALALVLPTETNAFICIVEWPLTSVYRYNISFISLTGYQLAQIFPRSMAPWRKAGQLGLTGPTISEVYSPPPVLINNFTHNLILLSVQMSQLALSPPLLTQQSALSHRSFSSNSTPPG